MSVALFGGAATLAQATPAAAATGPPGFVIEPAFIGDHYLPIQVTFLPDGRKLVTEQRGHVWVYTPDGVRLSTPFIDLNRKVMCCGGRGMLSTALDPDFVDNRWVYFLYVVDPDSDAVDFDSDSECFSRLERYQVSATNPDVVDTLSRQVLFGTQWSDGVPAADIYHTIGTIRFGRDKSLLVSTGDGAHFDTTDAGGLDPGQFLPGRSDPHANVGSFRSRTLDNLGGKVLRLDKETGYGLASNPFWDGNPMSTRSRIWVYGLRNPYRFCVKPGTGSTNPADGQPGTLYIGDTGWNTFEDVFVSRSPGLNYGWPCWEGPNVQPLYQSVTATASGDTNPLCGSGLNSSNPSPRTSPLIWWHHNDGTQSRPVGWAGRAVIGGTFQTGGNYPPPYAGGYFVTEYINGWTRFVNVNASDAIVGSGDFLTVNNTVERVLDLEVDPASGDLFYVTEQVGGVSGSVFRIRYNPTSTPRLASWRADSASGVAAYPSPGAATPWMDLGAGHHDAAVINFAGTAASGWVGNGTPTSPTCLQLDGVDDRVEVPAASIAELQTPTGATAALWIQTGTDVTREQELIDWVHQPPNTLPGMRLSIAAGQLRLWLNPWVNVAPVQPGTWYHVVTAKDTLGSRVYLNGALVYSSPTALLGGQLSKLQLGAPVAGPGGTTGKNFGGAIGECTLWSSGISGVEILSLYQRGLPVYESSAAQVLLFRADSATGTSHYSVPGDASPWRDLSGAHDAALANFDSTLASGWRGTGSVSSPWRLQFDGVDSRVVIPAGSVPALQAATSLTVAVWFKTGIDITSDQRVFEWLAGYGPPYSGMGIGISNGWLRALADSWADVVQVQPDTWYYVTLTKQSTGARVYVNGFKRYQTLIPNIGAQASEILFGASTQSGPGQYSSFFKGAVGMVGVWRRALLDPEVQEHFYEDAAEFIKPPGLTAMVVHLGADSAIAGLPPPVPSAAGPWKNLVTSNDAMLTNFQGDIASGWVGGSGQAPYRLQFDGLNDHAQIPAGSIVSLQSPSSASVALWVLTSPDVVRDQFLMEWVAQYQPPSAGMSLGIRDGYVRLWLRPWKNLAPVAPLSWYHVVITKDVDAVRGYVNGQLVLAGDTSLLGAQMSDLVLGAATFQGPGVLGNWLNGAIADLRVWPVSLTYDEALTLWNTQRDHYPGPWTTTDIDPGTARMLDLRESPNPFRQDIALEFSLARAGNVRLEIVSVDGRHVRTVAAAAMTAGTHRLRWDGLDDRGARVSQGLYFAHLSTPDRDVTRRLVYLR
jgi:glucose/arabinose dehydrogenase